MTITTCDVCGGEIINDEIEHTLIHNMTAKNKDPIELKYKIVAFGRGVDVCWPCLVNGLREVIKTL